MFDPSQRLVLLRVGNTLRFREQQGYGTQIQLWGAISEMLKEI